MAGYIRNTHASVTVCQ